VKSGLRVLVYFIWTVGVVTGHAEILSPVVVNLQNMDGNSRLGISLNIGGAGLNEIYLLDTGSSPLTSAYATGAPWWGTYTANMTETRSIIYGGGSGTQKFDYHPAAASVTLAGTTVSSPSDSSLAMIFSGYTNSDPHGNATWVPDTAFDQAVVDAVTTNDPPFASHVFGTLGADLSDSQSGLMHIVSSQTYGPSVTNGFLIDATSTGPTLTIGPDQATVAQFTHWFDMNTTGAEINQLLISPGYSIDAGGGQVSLGALPTLLDTGTPPDSLLFITQGSAVDVSAFTTNGYLNDGVSITMLLGDTPYTLTSDASHRISVYGNPSDSKSGGLTYGLNFFRDHQVLYDLDNKRVGILAVPEPSTFFCVLAAGLWLGFLRLTRRSRRSHG